jgi:hypothetical protein
VIVFGAEEGTAEVCRELSLRHEPRIDCNEFGTPFLNYAFDRAQEIARHDWLCYANCDIILTRDFVDAFERLQAWRGRFMMVGQRWDTDITEPFDFFAADWAVALRAKATSQGKQRARDAVDYFIFERGQCAGLPPFLVGRPCWDHWLIWWMRHRRVPVVDASSVVVAVHQNHDYSHLPEGAQSLNKGQEALRNRARVGSWRHLNTIDDASHVLDENGVRHTYRHWGVQLRREYEHLRNRVAVATGPVRHRLGLRKATLARLFAHPRD